MKVSLPEHLVQTLEARLVDAAYHLGRLGLRHAARPLDFELLCCLFMLASVDLSFGQNRLRHISFKILDHRDPRTNLSSISRINGQLPAASLKATVD